ncbi:restriction endonuclease subunit S [Acinetobacter sp. YH01021]|jgi:type I restriction enzyme, S subunit|uniref:restriction endonuclease subunit S n=1 Tax=Acinetobacter sp. YH01021 TaxID=2601035 RepID=UPI0015D24390|nr:restriction endonuclease subunit S [Acinetobacter sp. YH01021]
MSVPKLRFKEFDGRWSSLKYKDVLTIKYGKDHKLLNEGIYPVYGTGGIMRYADQYLHDGESILIGRKGTIDQPKYVDEKFWTVDTLFYTQIKDNSIPLFLYQHALQVNWSGLNEATGVPSLNTTSINNVDIALPPKEEQRKIASFLSAVDEKISQLTQKHQLLSQYKQGMMQKLFSQQIRFKADDGSEFGEWEDKRISEIASYRRGSFPQPYGLPEWLNENGFPFVQVYDVADNMLLKDKTKIKISQLAANQSVFAKTGTLIITLQGSIGRVAKMQYDAYVDRTLLIFQSYSMPINTDYFKYALYLLFNIEKEKADGGIIKTITKETLSKFNIGIPCLEEQTKIANFLSAMDQKIEVVAQQIEQAKQWKKGLLQQMFV